MTMLPRLSRPEVTLADVYGGAGEVGLVTVLLLQHWGYAPEMPWWADLAPVWAGLIMGVTVGLIRAARIWFTE